MYRYIYVKYNMMFIVEYMARKARVLKALSEDF